MATPTTPKKPAKHMLTHVDRTTTAYTGPVKVDATAVAPILIDLPPGAKRGLRTSGAGIAGVLTELASAVPTDGAAAGVSAPVYASLVTNSANLAALLALQAVAAKLAEVIDETIAVLEDQREQQLSQIADSIRSTAKRTRNAGVKAHFQKTLAYNAEGADKGVKTRKANKAAAAATTPTATATATTPAATPTPATAAATPTAAH